ncbi:MAG: hypothetical protein ACK4NC_04280 [Candidatus Gracilibacteria bacterium]
MSKKIVSVSRGSAFIYLKTLFYKSKLFESAMNKCFKNRELYNFRLVDQALMIDQTSSAFLELAKEFYIPKFFYSLLSKRIAEYPERIVLNTVTHLTTTSYNGNGTASIAPVASMVPYVTLQVPYDITSVEFRKMWKEIDEQKKLIQHFFFDTRIWDKGRSFDIALRAYQLKNGGMTMKTALEYIYKEFEIKKNYSSIETIIYKEVKEIEKQINSIRLYSTLVNKKLM